MLLFNKGKLNKIDIIYICINLLLGVVKMLIEIITENIYTILDEIKDKSIIIFGTGKGGN